MAIHRETWTNGNLFWYHRFGISSGKLLLSSCHFEIHPASKFHLQQDSLPLCNCFFQLAIWGLNFVKIDLFMSSGTKFLSILWDDITIFWDEILLWFLTNAFSFYRSQNVLGWSKFFVSDQKFIYILWQSQTFCDRQKEDLHSVKLFFVPAQKFLKRH